MIFLTNDTLTAEVSLVALYKDTTGFSVIGNGLNLHLTALATQASQYADFAKAAVRSGKTINLNSSDLTFSITKLTSKSLGWLDKLTVNVRRALTVRNKQFSFRDSRATGLNKTCNFSIINSTNSNINLWDVTDPLNPYEQSFNTNGAGIDFITRVDSINEFCIAPSTDFYTPVFVSKITNQNLHSITKANYLIIAHPSLVGEAEHLGAFHQQKEGLSYKVATTDQIYNEFGSGKQDVAAIRDFIRMVYTRTINLPGRSAIEVCSS